MINTRAPDGANKCKFGYEKRPTLLQLFFEKNPNFKISTGGGGEAQRG